VRVQLLVDRRTLAADLEQARTDIQRALGGATASATRSSSS
jgi:hypothetical protein